MKLLPLYEVSTFHYRFTVYKFNKRIRASEKELKNRRRERGRKGRG